MKINITATSMELTPAIKEYVEKKVKRLTKFLDGSASTAQASVEIGKTSQHHHTGNVFRAELQVQFHKYDKHIRAVAEESDLYAAIDKAHDEIKTELTKIKEKKISLLRRGARKVKRLFISKWDDTSNR